VSGQFHDPTALPSGNSRGTHWIELNVGLNIEIYFDSLKWVEQIFRSHVMCRCILCEFEIVRILKHSTRITYVYWIMAMSSGTHSSHKIANSLCCKTNILGQPCFLHTTFSVTCSPSPLFPHRLWGRTRASRLMRLQRIADHTTLTSVHYYLGILSTLRVSYCLRIGVLYSEL
jgi:hypothetical protein